MQYIVTAYDGKDSEACDRRLKAREAHIDLGNKLRDSKNLLYAVAILSDKNNMIGSICIVDFPLREDLDKWLQIEPYVIGKVWEKIDIQPCRVGPSFAT